MLSGVRRPDPHWFFRLVTIMLESHNGFVTLASDSETDKPVLGFAGSEGELKSLEDDLSVGSK